MSEATQLQLKEKGEQELIPKEVFGIEIEQGPTVAEKLKHAMQKKEKKIFFNNKEYAEFSDLQIISDYFGLSIRTHDASPVEIHGVKGFKAQADLVNKDGIVVGGAEAYCMTDEPNWTKKPLFQLASMAQTRAASKSISNRYRWVVAMAGYGTTPAEEMPEVIHTEMTKEEPKKIPAIPEWLKPTGNPRPNCISDKQAKRFYAIYKASGKTDNAVKEYLFDQFGIADSREITRDIYEQVCIWAAAK